MTTRAVTRQKRVRYRSASSATRIFAPILSVIFWGPGLALLIRDVVTPGGQGSGGPVDIGLGAFLTVAGLAFIGPAFRPRLVLTTHTLRRPRLLRRAHITPLDQVTGIGLVYKRQAQDPTPQGWFLYLWTAGDVPRDTGISYQPFRWLHPAGKVRQKFLAFEPAVAERDGTFNSHRFSLNFNPVTQTDPDKIAATYPGRVAREIYDRVLAYQGPSGLLAVRQDQKHVPVAGPWLRTSYWSPDGEFGRATTEWR